MLGTLNIGVVSAIGSAAAPIVFHLPALSAHFRTKCRGRASLRIEGPIRAVSTVWTRPHCTGLPTPRGMSRVEIEEECHRDGTWRLRISLCSTFFSMPSMRAGRVPEQRLGNSLGQTQRDAPAPPGDSGAGASPPDGLRNFVLLAGVFARADAMLLGSDPPCLRRRSRSCARVVLLAGVWRGVRWASGGSLKGTPDAFRTDFRRNVEARVVVCHRNAAGPPFVECGDVRWVAMIAAGTRRECGDQLSFVFFRLNLDRDPGRGAIDYTSSTPSPIHRGRGDHETRIHIGRGSIESSSARSWAEFGRGSAQPGVGPHRAENHGS